MSEAPDSSAPEQLALDEARAVERADVLAYLARRKANAARIAQAVPEFEDEARWIGRNIDVLSDYLRAGLHEGAAFTAAALAEAPCAAESAYPFRDHRSLAEADDGGSERC